MAYFSLQTSAWILTLISIDRYFILTSSTWKRKFSKNIKLTLSVIISIILFGALINLPVTFLNGEIKIYNTTSILGNASLITEIDCYTTDYMKFWEKFMLCNECIIPLILMIIFNSLLIYKTYKSSVKLKKMQLKEKQHQCEKSELQQRDQQLESSTNKIPSTTSNIIQNYEKIESFDLIKNRSNKNKLSVSDLDLKIRNIKTTDNLKKRRCSTPNLINVNRNIDMSKNVLNNKKKVLTPPVLLNVMNSSSIIKSDQSKDSKERSENKEFLNELDEILAKKRMEKSKTDTKKREKIIDTNKHSQRRNRRIVIMLVLLTSSFTISTFPSTMFYSFFRPFMNNKPYKRLLTLIFTLLRHLSHSFNFLIYFKYSTMIKQELNTIVNFKKFKHFIRVNFIYFFRFWCSKVCCCFIYSIIGKKVPDRYKKNKYHTNSVKKNLKSNIKTMLNESLMTKTEYKVNESKFPIEINSFNNINNMVESEEDKKRENELKIDKIYFEKRLSCNKKSSLLDKNIEDKDHYIHDDIDDENDDYEDSKIKDSKRKIPSNNLNKWKLVFYAINTSNNFKKN
jgi:hypothetical protein